MSYPQEPYDPNRPGTGRLQGDWNVTETVQDSVLEAFAARIEQSAKQAFVMGNELSYIADRIFGPVPESAIAGEGVGRSPVSAVDRISHQLSVLNHAHDKISNMVARLNKL